jgi:predicted N-acetyltransferase YhbS
MSNYGRDNMEVELRLETKDDWAEVENVIREAFWSADRVEKIGVGCDEHYLAHSLRESEYFIPELDYIAVDNGRIIGNVMYSKAYVLQGNGVRHNVLNVGPLAVLPAYQRRGIGSALMKSTLKRAARLGYGSVLFFGHPTYYPRFGLKEAKEYHITTYKGTNFPAFMGMELLYGDLDGISGKYFESPLYKVDPEKAREYDKLFPPRI